MRHSRSDSATIKNCATAHGVTERAVRSWRVRDDARWRAWLARSARASSEQLDAFASAGGQATTPASETEAARRRFLALTKMVDQSTARGEVAGLPVLLRSAQESQRLLQGCRAAQTEWELQKKMVVPVSEVRALKELFIQPIFETWRRMPMEAAPEANPSDPHLAAEALQRWLQARLRPAVEAAMAEIDKTSTPSP
jgi:hypothetical protein